MKKNLVRLAGAAALVSAAGAAQAVSCDPAYLAQYPSYQSYCPGASPAFATRSILATVGTQVSAISNAIMLMSFGNPAERRLAFGPDGGVTGVAAGDATKGFNMWTNLSQARVGVGYQPLQSSGHVDNEILGADYRVSKSMVVGASLAFDQTRIGTDYNGGNLRGHGYTFAPYLAVQINKTWSADFSAGIGEGSQLMTAAGATAGFDVDRRFFAANLNYERWMGDWQMAGKASYLDSTEKKLGLKDTLRQMRVGAQVGYWADGLMPYVSLAYSVDLRRPEQIALGAPLVQPANDKTAWLLGVGVNFFSKGAWSGGLSYTSELDRKESKQNTFMANLGYRF